MNPVPLLVVLMSLSLLFGGVGIRNLLLSLSLQREIQQEVKDGIKPLEKVPVNPNLKYKIKGDTVTITKCDMGASGELTIPTTIQGKYVTSIGRSAFSDCTGLSSVPIFNKVESIGETAFAS
mgnify:CR=1 FL=1